MSVFQKLYRDVLGEVMSYVGSNLNWDGTNSRISLLKTCRELSRYKDDPAPSLANDRQVQRTELIKEQLVISLLTFGVAWLIRKHLPTIDLTNACNQRVVIDSVGLLSKLFGLIESQ